MTKLEGIKAVVFDVFGTLVSIGEKRRPYGRLLQLLARNGREPQPDDATRIMTNDVGLAGAAALFGMELPASSIAALELELYTELATIGLFPDAVQALNALRVAGYQLGLCSNLAAPYAVPVKLLLPFTLDAYAWSFEVGIAKPDPHIYENVCSQLGCLPHQVLMVGDTPEADFAAPQRFGMHGVHLSRNGTSGLPGAVRSLQDVVACLTS
jgi:FMN phosphatase YigB (HAD superfamily)